jgi:hypothetical protein
MSGKYKAFLIRFVTLIIFLAGFMLLAKRLLPAEEYGDFPQLLAGVIPALLLSPRVQVAEHQSGRRYGIKFLFSSKIWWFD